VVRSRYQITNEVPKTPRPDQAQGVGQTKLAVFVELIAGAMIIWIIVINDIEAPEAVPLVVRPARAVIHGHESPQEIGGPCDPPCHLVAVNRVAGVARLRLLTIASVSTATRAARHTVIGHCHTIDACRGFATRHAVVKPIIGEIFDFGGLWWCGLKHEFSTFERVPPVARVVTFAKLARHTSPPTRSRGMRNPYVQYRASTVRLQVLNIQSIQVLMS